jgi:hypothetical protein
MNASHRLTMAQTEDSQTLRTSLVPHTLAAHCRQVNKKPLKKDNSVFLREMVITSTEV